MKHYLFLTEEYPFDRPQERNWIAIDAISYEVALKQAERYFKLPIDKCWLVELKTGELINITDYRREWVDEQERIKMEEIEIERERKNRELYRQLKAKYGNTE